VVLAATSCRPGRAPPSSQVHSDLAAASSEDALTLADTLERLVESGAAGEGERRFAYDRIQGRPMATAADALGHAQIIGRLAQTQGLAAKGLVAKIEAAARRSMELDPKFRNGAAQRLLGSLYVKAPARLLEHGDSETGLELLEELAEQYPRDAQTRLRVAEAYVALSDPEPAQPHLCFAKQHSSELRSDHAALLKELFKEAEFDAGECVAAADP
jgi:hypothetical protein